MPMAARMGVRPFYGDLHNHCNLSYGHGSLGEALKNAHRQLDFVSVTGHAHWPDMPVDDPRVAHIVDFHVKGFARLEQQWPDHFTELRQHDDPTRFTVFPGYEIHSCEHGDYTIVLRDLNREDLLKAGSPAQLETALREQVGKRAFAFPHHIGYRTGARGINWESFRETLSPVLEMFSMHGCSETSLTDMPFLHSMGPADGYNTVHHGLNAGHVFGVLGNTDHHSGYPGSYGHGRSAIYAAENNSKELWDAIHARHTNALTGDNTHLLLSLDGAMQGEIVSACENAALSIEAVAGSFIDYIDVIKNGRLIHRVSPQINPDPIESTGNTLETQLVLELGWGSRGSHHDWLGEIAIEHGKILAVEPRLRGPEIVSPLEGEASEAFTDRVHQDGNRIEFAVRAYANPNNRTASTQAIAARVALSAEAVVRLRIDGQSIEVPCSRLLDGALSGNIGPIDSPAFLLHPLPRRQDWQWCGNLRVPELEPGDWIMARMRQLNRQWTWTSPIFCR